MLVVVQFPIFDPRGLEDALSADRLRKPRWPTPDQSQQFIRSFGGVFARRNQGLQGFFAEEWLCRANRAVRFPRLSSLALRDIPGPDGSDHVEIWPRVAFRHFFLDGQTTGKFEIGFFLATPYERDCALDEPQAFAEHLLDQPVRVRGATSRQPPLVKAGPLLAELYEKASTWRDRSLLRRLRSAVFGPRETPGCKAGAPLVLLVGAGGSPLPNIRAGYREAWLEAACIQSWHRRIRGDIVHFIAISEPGQRNTDLARNLRLFLNRIHAELVTAEFALTSIEARAAAKRRLTASLASRLTAELDRLDEDRLQVIARLVEKIGKSARALANARNEPVKAMGEAVLASIWGSRLDAVEDRLAVVRRKVERAAGAAPVASPGRVISRHPHRVFMSYRRKDTGAVADRIARSFPAALPRSTLFHDVTAIGLGENWRGDIVDALQHCDRVLALIGPDWAAPTSLGQRRIDDPRDIVRLELEIAMEQGVPILPVLVDGAGFPPGLSGPLALLPDINAARIDRSATGAGALDPIFAELAR